MSICNIVISLEIEGIRDEAFDTIDAVLDDGTIQDIIQDVGEVRGFDLEVTSAMSMTPGMLVGAAQAERTAGASTRVALVRLALDKLREARDLLVEAEAPRAAAKVRTAMKSAEGAERNAYGHSLRGPVAGLALPGKKMRDLPNLPTKDPS